jgi:hypothetical protein
VKQVRSGALNASCDGLCFKIKGITRWKL